MGYHDYERGYQDGRSHSLNTAGRVLPGELSLYLFIIYLFGMLCCYMYLNNSGHSMWWMIISPLWPIIVVVGFIFLILAIPYNLLF